MSINDVSIRLRFLNKYYIFFITKLIQLLIIVYRINGTVLFQHQLQSKKVHSNLQFSNEDLITYVRSQLKKGHWLLLFGEYIRSRKIMFNKNMVSNYGCKKIDVKRKILYMVDSNR